MSDYGFSCVACDHPYAHLKRFSSRMYSHADVAGSPPFVGSATASPGTLKRVQSWRPSELLRTGSNHGPLPSSSTVFRSFRHPSSSGSWSEGDGLDKAGGPTAVAVLGTAVLTALEQLVSAFVDNEQAARRNVAQGEQTAFGAIARRFQSQLDLVKALAIKLRSSTQASTTATSVGTPQTATLTDNRDDVDWDLVLECPWKTPVAFIKPILKRDARRGVNGANVGPTGWNSFREGVAESMKGSSKSRTAAGVREQLKQMRLVLEENPSAAAATDVPGSPGSPSYPGSGTSVPIRKLRFSRTIRVVPIPPRPSAFREGDDDDDAVEPSPATTASGDFEEPYDADDDEVNSQASSVDLGTLAELESVGSLSGPPPNRPRSRSTDRGRERKPQGFQDRSGRRQFERRVSIDARRAMAKDAPLAPAGSDERRMLQDALAHPNQAGSLLRDLAEDDTAAGDLADATTPSGSAAWEAAPSPAGDGGKDTDVAARIASSVESLSPQKRSGSSFLRSTSSASGRAEKLKFAAFAARLAVARPALDPEPDTASYHPAVDRHAYVPDTLGYHKSVNWLQQVQGKRASRQALRLHRVQARPPDHPPKAEDPNTVEPVRLRSRVARRNSIANDRRWAAGSRVSSSASNALEADTSRQDAAAALRAKLSEDDFVDCTITPSSVVAGAPDGDADSCHLTDDNNNNSLVDDATYRWVAADPPPPRAWRACLDPRGVDARRLASKSSGARWRVQGEHFREYTPRLPNRGCVAVLAQGTILDVTDPRVVVTARSCAPEAESTFTAHIRLPTISTTPTANASQPDGAACGDTATERARVRRALLNLGLLGSDEHPCRCTTVGSRQQVTVNHQAPLPPDNCHRTGRQLTPRTGSRKSTRTQCTNRAEVTKSSTTALLAELERLVEAGEAERMPLAVSPSPRAKAAASGPPSPRITSSPAPPTSAISKASDAKSRHVPTWARCAVPRDRPPQRRHTLTRSDVTSDPPLARAAAQIFGAR
jgi:hypothetical protein